MTRAEKGRLAVGKVRSADLGQKTKGNSENSIAYFQPKRCLVWAAGIWLYSKEPVIKVMT